MPRYEPIPELESARLESQAARRWFNLLDELDWVAYTFDPVYGPTKDFNFDYAAGKGARVIAEVLAHPRGHELAQPRQYPCPRCWGTGSLESSDSTDDGWWDCPTCQGTGKLADRRKPQTGVVNS